MELIYFIIGTLWIVVAYTAYQNHKLKNNSIELKLDLEDLSYIVERQIQGTSEDLYNLRRDIRTINTKLSEDSYHNIAEVNKQLDTLDKMANAMNVRFGEANKISEKQLSVAFTEIQQLKNNIKAFVQDPNIIDR